MATEAIAFIPRLWTPVQTNDASARTWLVAHVRRGLLAIEVDCGNHQQQAILVSPLALIASNRSLQKTLEELSSKAGIQQLALSSSNVIIREAETDQYWINLCDDTPAIPLFRGSRLVDLTKSAGISLKTCGN